MSKEPTVIGMRRKAASKDSTASYQNRRQEITEAAVRVFHRLGYNAASLSAVAAELGVDRATLYYYFSSKEQLFDDIVRTVLEGNYAMSRRIADSQMTPRRKMREFILAMMNGYHDHYPMLYIYIREDLRQVTDQRSEWSATMRNLNREIEQAVIDIIEQGFEDGSFRRIGPAKIVAYGILGSLNWTHRWYRPERGEVRAGEVANIFADMLLSGLETPY